MSRFVHIAVSHITIVGYLLVVTWGPAWHDHQHGHSHADSAANSTPSGGESGHSHAHCCSHHHSKCCDGPVEPSDRLSVPPRAPCHSPLHDDECPVCQTLAHPPLATPRIELIDAPEPVQGWVAPTAPLVACLFSPVYDSRGPPLV
jgi:hypothetical protein